MDTLKQGIMQLTFTGDHQRNIKTVLNEFKDQNIADYENYLAEQS